MSTTSGDDAISMSANEYPFGRLKFLCSYGGRILHRPSDGLLKYVGGETRVVSVPRGTTFTELMKKLTSLFEAEVVLKYQLFSEDLDALVSVTCDEDLHNMIDEYDRHHQILPSTNSSHSPSSCGGGSARLRAFLFPVCPPLLDPSATATARDSLEQSYIDAINGVRTPRHHHPLGNYHQHPPSSNGSSPRSVKTERAANSSNNEVPLLSTSTLQRVLSSPNLLCNNNGTGTSHPSRRCAGGQRAGKAPTGRAPPPPTVAPKTMQRSGSGKFYSPAQRRPTPSDEGRHRRQGSSGCVNYEGDWRL